VGLPVLEDRGAMGHGEALAPERLRLPPVAHRLRRCGGVPGLIGRRKGSGLLRRGPPGYPFGCPVASGAGDLGRTPLARNRAGVLAETDDARYRCGGISRRRRGMRLVSRLDPPSARGTPRSCSGSPPGYRHAETAGTDAGGSRG
jgi:hypothetical protein